MLKPSVRTEKTEIRFPAAFRRLCVETVVMAKFVRYFLSQPPSGGCVLKLEDGYKEKICRIPAAFRRLCVETESGTF